MKGDIGLMFIFGVVTGFLFVCAASHREAITVHDHAATCEYPVDEITAAYIRGYAEGSEQ